MSPCACYGFRRQTAGPTALPQQFFFFFSLEDSLRFRFMHALGFTKATGYFSFKYVGPTTIRLNFSLVRYFISSDLIGVVRPFYPFWIR